jgi:hypothetical protein
VPLFYEFVGVMLVGYGIWYGYKGIVRLFGSEKDWWRPRTRRQRYPYPAAGVLLGICFVVLGLRFAIQNVWEHARILGWVGIGLVIVVIVLGVVQPRFLHPRWYARLHDRLDRRRVILLQQKAQRTPYDEWVEVVASDASFEQWVNRNVPSSPQGRGRAYAKNTDRESDK